MSDAIGQIVLAGLLVLTMLVWQYQLRRFEQEREKWQAERKDLLDRIQAPTFAEYANKVIREKKLEQPQEEEEEEPYIS